MNDSSNGGSRRSGTSIVLWILFTIFAPFIAIPAFFIANTVSNHPKESESFGAIAFVICMAIVFIVAPVASIVNIATKGLATTFKEDGVLLSFAFMELELVFVFIWFAFVHPLLTPSKHNDDMMVKNDEPTEDKGDSWAVIITILAACFGFFAIIISDNISIFFAPLILIHGIVFAVILSSKSSN